MRKSKGTRSSDWKDGFLFLGNQLGLDFLNTRPVQGETFLELLPDFSALLRWFQAADLLTSHEARALEQQWGESSRARRTVEAMREWRERLRQEVSGWERSGALRSSTVAELNKLMAEHPMRARLSKVGNSFSNNLYFEAREPEDLFAPLAHAAAMLLANADHRRVRKCLQCVLHFQDTSKKGTRRWCSMRLCGNRKKVAAYAARQRRLQRKTERA